MAKKIYIGNMIQDLQSSIADLQTDMGTMSTDMGTMSTDMASMVSELIALKETMGQGVSTLNVKPGTDNSVVLNTAEISHKGDVITKKISFLCKCDGIISFVGEVKATHTAYFYYSVNAGANVPIITTTSTSYVAATIDIIVKNGDVVDILLQAFSVSNTAYLKEGATIQYNIVDIVNDGAIIV